MFFTIDKIRCFSKTTIHIHSKINYKCSKDKTFEFHIYKLDFHYICTNVQVHQLINIKVKKLSVGNAI